MKSLIKNAIFIFFIYTSIWAQYNGSNFAVSTNYSFNTTANIFLSPDSEDPFESTSSFEIEGIHSYSFELRYRLTNSMILGFSAEYMKESARGRNLTSSQFLIRDGFELMPFEFSLLYFLPFSTEDFKFYMGGGFGLYTGKRTREFGDTKFVDVNSEIGYGIQVNTGLDYMIFNFLSVRGEFRFRDPDFRITNKYDSDKVTYNNRTYTVTQENIDSKINLDGITFRIGAVYHFSIQ